MVGLDAQDGGVPRPEVQEIGPILARLDQHQAFSVWRVPWPMRVVGMADPHPECAFDIAPGASAGSCPQGRGPAEHGRIASRLDQDMGGHRRGGRLPVRAGDGHGVAIRREPAEHLEIAEHRDSEFGGPTKLGIGRRDGVAIDDQFRLGRKMFGGVALEPRAPPSLVDFRPDRSR